MQDDMDFTSFLLLLWKRKNIIISTILIVLASAIVYTLLAGVTYRSSATIVPLQDAGFGVGQLEGALPSSGVLQLAGLGGISNSNSSEKLMSLLQSRSIARAVYSELKEDIHAALYKDIWMVDRQSWKPSIKTPTEQSIITAFRETMDFKKDIKTGVLEIICEISNKHLAKNIIDLYIEKLREMLNRNIITVAKRDEEFIGEQLKETKSLLLSEGKLLANYYTRNNVSAREDKVYFDSSQPQNSNSTASSQHLIELPSQVYLNFLGERQLILKQLYALTEQKYHLAKVKTKHEELGFQVIDPPEVPHSKYRPKRTLIVVTAAFGAIFWGIINALLAQAWENTRSRLREIGMSRS